MRYILALAGYFLLPVMVWGQTGVTGMKLTEGANLLFKNIKTNISNAEKNWIYQKLGLSLTSDRKGFMVGTEYPVDVYVYPTDMNKDGKEELFISMKSGALFGNTGENFALYIRNNVGTYVQEDELGGGIPIILTSSKPGYPEILIGGPGFEFSVFRWNGKKYVRNRVVKDSYLATTKSQDIETYSKAYAN